MAILAKGGATFLSVLSLASVAKTLLLLCLRVTNTRALCNQALDFISLIWFLNPSIAAGDSAPPSLRTACVAA
jgi:hypothetical protein